MGAGCISCLHSGKCVLVTVNENRSGLGQRRSALFDSVRHIGYINWSNFVQRTCVTIPSARSHVWHDLYLLFRPARLVVPLHFYGAYSISNSPMKNRTLLFTVSILVLSLTVTACTPQRVQVNNVEKIEQSTTASSSSVVNLIDGTTTATASANIVIELTASNPAVGETALDLLKKSGAQVQATSYGDAGSFVTSINDVTGDATNYWAFYLNDEYAQQAADKTVVKDGDRIKFVYERVVMTP